MERLITAPSIYIVGMTTINTGELHNWASEHGYHAPYPEPLAQCFEDEGSSGLVEFAGRHCYRSFSKGRDTYDYIKNIIESDHGSVLEHVNFTFAISGISRTLTHELVRHRVGVAISQESQRYVPATDIKFVVPPLYLWLSEGDLSSPQITKWASHCYDSLAGYNDMLHGLQDLTLQHQAGEKGEMLDSKRRTEAARSLLLGASESRMVWTANIRTLRHVFDKRGGQPADLEIRRWAVALFNALDEWDNQLIALFFDDFVELEEELGVPILCRKY